MAALNSRCSVRATHGRVLGKRFDSVLGRQMRADPVEQLREPPALIGGNRTRHELRLASLAMGRDHQPLRHLVGDPGPKVLTHQVHQHVQAGRGARRGQYLPLVDVQRVGFDHDVRISSRETLNVLPMRGRAFASQHAGCRKHENTGADRAQSRATIVGLP